MNKKRFCRVCGDVTIWKLDKVINHSYCKNCSARFGMSNKKRILKFINEEYQENLTALNKKLEKTINNVEQMCKENEEAKK